MDIGKLMDEERNRRQLLGDTFLAPLQRNASDVARNMEHIHSIQRDIAEAREAPTARRAVDNIAVRIRAFEAALDASSEVGVHLVSFGGSTVLHIREVDYEQPNLIFFRGCLDDGSPVELIQHLSQLSFLLMRVPRLEPDKPRPPIGFSLGAEEP